MRVRVSDFEVRDAVVSVDGERVGARVVRFRLDVGGVGEGVVDDVVDRLCDWLGESRVFRELVEAVAAGEASRVLRLVPRILVEDGGALEAKTGSDGVVEAVFYADDAPSSARELEEMLSLLVADLVAEKVAEKLKKTLRTLFRDMARAGRRAGDYAAAAGEAETARRHRRIQVDKH